MIKEPNFVKRYLLDEGKCSIAFFDTDVITIQIGYSDLFSFEIKRTIVWIDNVLYCPKYTKWGMQDRITIPNEYVTFVKNAIDEIIANR